MPKQSLSHMIMIAENTNPLLDLAKQVVVDFGYTELDVKKELDADPNPPPDYIRIRFMNLIRDVSRSYNTQTKGV